MRRLNLVAAVMGILALGVGGAAFGAPWAGPAPSAPEAVSIGDPPDRLIFKNGRIVRGRVLEETETQVRFMVVVAGIEGEQVYSKADLLAIERGEASEKASQGAEARAPERRRADPEPREGAPGVYVVNIEGYYGRDISPTPVRQIAKDILQHEPEYVIIVVDNAWQYLSGQEFGDDVNEFDQFRITEEIEPIFTKELPDMLGYTPKYVAWVKNAMGGAAFLPLNFDTIYFSSNGRVGGIGRIEEMFGSTGDESVREKQFSLRLARARGMANRGGYDGRIIEAMARTDYVLSYRIEGGRAVLFEGMPNPERNEHLLTDDGQGENEDTIQERARGQGNDNLTLTADIARTIGVSKGTVDDMDALLYELEIERNHRMIESREERIRRGWTRSVENAEMQLRDLLEEFARIQVGGERRERQAARAQQIAKLRQMIGLVKRFDEVISVGMFELPEGMPPVPAMEVMIEQIRQEQMKDR